MRVQGTGVDGPDLDVVAPRIVLGGCRIRLFWPGLKRENVRDRSTTISQAEYLQWFTKFCRTVGFAIDRTGWPRLMCVLCCEPRNRYAASRPWRTAVRRCRSVRTAAFLCADRTSNSANAATPFPSSHRGAQLHAWQHAATFPSSLESPIR